jgi:hypothetical protein
MAVKMLMFVLGVVTLCGLLGRYQHFGGKCCLPSSGQNYFLRFQYHGFGSLKFMDFFCSDICLHFSFPSLNIVNVNSATAVQN